MEYVDDQKVINIIEKYLDELEYYNVKIMDTHQYTQLLRRSQNHHI